MSRIDVWTLTKSIKMFAERGFVSFLATAMMSRPSPYNLARRASKYFKRRRSSSSASPPLSESSFSNSPRSSIEVNQLVEIHRFFDSPPPLAPYVRLYILSNPFFFLIYFLSQCQPVEPSASWDASRRTMGPYFVCYRTLWRVSIWLFYLMFHSSHISSS